MSPAKKAMKDVSGEAALGYEEAFSHLIGRLSRLEDEIRRVEQLVRPHRDFKVKVNRNKLSRTLQHWTAEISEIHDSFIRYDTSDIQLKDQYKDKGPFCEHGHAG